MPRDVLPNRSARAAGWAVAIGVAAGVRIWDALAGPLMWGYDAWGHVAYVLYLDLYRALPWADQGWSYYHPPLHYILGFLLAQAGRGDVLVRGLALLGGAFSLAIAGLGALLTRWAAPARPGLALVSFAAVAFLPVHLYVGLMPGNEMTLAFLNAATIAAFVANERRGRPTLAAAGATGVVCGLALLTKFTGLLGLLAAAVSLGLRAWLERGRPGAARAALARAGAIALVAAVIAGPIYLRNLRHFGTPLPSNSDFALVWDVEKLQPPGERTWLDYLRVSPRLFSDPTPTAPHLLHSVWGSVYLNAWADAHRESDVERALVAERQVQRSATWMAVLGVVPTGLALVGAVLALRDARRGRRRWIYLPLLLLAGVNLAAFVQFTWNIPTWAALKAAYLLSLSLPFAVFVARALEALLDVGRGAVLACAALATAACGAAVVGSVGVALPRRADAPATGALRFYFQEFDAARRVYGRLIAGAVYKVPWLDNLAAVELADGRPERARRLYARAVAIAAAAGRPDPYRGGRLAVASALADDLPGALAELDAALELGERAELRANRGALHLARGELALAEGDLRAALESESGLVPGWLNLAVTLERSGRVEEATRARARAAVEACRAPRRYPYGIGTGEVLEWGVGRRPLLVAEAGGLRAAGPRFYREACHRLRGRAS